MMLEFKKINQADRQEFEEAINLYLSSFPLSERHPVDVICERISQGSNELYIGRQGGETVFMALLWPLKKSDFILLDYMATKDTHRGRGIATAFLNWMHSTLRDHGKYFILEVEDPDYGDNRAERERRVAFYKRSGVREMKGVKYMLPPLQGSAPTEMILMIFPEYKNAAIEADTVKRTIAQIYHELYGRNVDDSLLNSFIHDLRGVIELV